LQLSENIFLIAICCIYTLSSAKKAKWTAGVWERVSLLNKLFRVGVRTEPSSAPVFLSLGVDNSPSTVTLKFLLVKNELISLIKFAENCRFCNLYIKAGCHVVS